MRIFFRDMYWFLLFLLLPLLWISITVTRLFLSVYAKAGVLPEAVMVFKESDNGD